MVQVDCGELGNGTEARRSCYQRWKMVEEVVKVYLVVLVIVVSCPHNCFVDPQYEPSGQNVPRGKVNTRETMGAVCSTPPLTVYHDQR